MVAQEGHFTFFFFPAETHFSRLGLFWSCHGMLYDWDDLVIARGMIGNGLLVLL